MSRLSNCLRLFGLTASFVILQSITANPALLAQQPQNTRSAPPRLAAHYLFYVVNGTVYAENGATGAIDYSGSDACKVVNRALVHAESSCGLVQFRDGVYNCRSLTRETIPVNRDPRRKVDLGLEYAFAIPPDTGTPGQQCEWHIEGESMTNGNGWEMGGAVQTNGVILNITGDAVHSVDSRALIAGFWQRPNTHGMQGNQDFFKNLTIRFPSNQRGNEVGFYPLVASTVDYENILADFNKSYCSLAPPVAGTVGSVGIASTRSEQGNMQGFKNTVAVGWDTCYSLMSEHIEGATMTAAFCRYAAKVGDAFNGNESPIYHPGRVDRFVDQENINGLVFGPLMKEGTLFNISNYDMETTTSNTYTSPPGLCANLHRFARSSYLRETNSGYTAGTIDYTHVQACRGIVTDAPGTFFSSGGEHFLVRQSNSTFDNGSVQTTSR